MKKNINGWWILLIVLLIAYNAIILIIPFEKNLSFLISYLFTLFALVSQIYVINKAFCKGNGTVRSRFYGWPIAKVGFIYAVSQLIISIFFMSLSKFIALWVMSVVYIIMLVLFIVGMVSVVITRNIVEEQDYKLINSTFRMKQLRAEAENIVNKSNNAAIRKELVSISEKLRYSDPVSSEYTKNIENEIDILIKELSNLITNADENQIYRLINNINRKIDKRNIACKNSKQY